MRVESSTQVELGVIISQATNCFCNSTQSSQMKHNDQMLGN